MIRQILTHPRLPLFLALLAVLLSLPALWTGWQFDDYVHRAYLLPDVELSEAHPSPIDLFGFLRGDVQQNRRLMEIGLLPWWTYDGLRLSFWRPVAALTHWLDYRLWPDSPALMHAHSLLWFGILVALVALLYRQTVAPAWAAGLAAFLYAVDDARAVPASWIANRNALISAVFAVAALVLHDRWRRRIGTDGRPTEATFVFDSPLEDPAYRWLAWRAWAYAPFPLPAVGDSVSLPPAQLPF